MNLKFWRFRDNQNKKINRKVFASILAVIIIVVVIFLILWQTGLLATLKIAYQMQKTQADDAQVLAQLGKIIDLPQDAKPMMAVVNDAEALKKDQPGFFAKAKNGDRVIVYSDMAILFDAKANKIMHIGPVDFGQQALGTVAFALYNGSGSEEKLAAFEQKLTTTFKNAAVKVKDKASKVYDKTLVIDLKGNNPEIQKIAEAVGAKVSELPVGEVAPQGIAVLVIVGKE
jgi:hypothetical protein